MDMHINHIYTSAKTFTKRIPVGMGAAKSNETSERPMNDPCLLRCLTPSLNHIYIIMQHDMCFLHALKVPPIVYHNLHRKKYTLVMKKVHEQVAKIS